MGKGNSRGWDSTNRVSSDGIFLIGGLAQLARALDLHSRGHRFDSDILHDSIE